MSVNINLESTSKLEIINKLSVSYQQEVQSLLVSIYGAFLNDRLTLDDIEELGYRYGVDVRCEYDKLQMSEDEDE